MAREGSQFFKCLCCVHLCIHLSHPKQLICANLKNKSSDIQCYLKKKTTTALLRFNLHIPILSIYFNEFCKCLESSLHHHDHDREYVCQPKNLPCGPLSCFPRLCPQALANIVLLCVLIVWVFFLEFHLHGIIHTQLFESESFTQHNALERCPCCCVYGSLLGFYPLHCWTPV